jgi:hypothetical protein
MQWWLALLFRQVSDRDHVVSYFLVEFRPVLCSKWVVVFLREGDRWVNAF